MFKARDLMMSMLPMNPAQMEEVLRDGAFACDGGCSACTGSCSPCTRCSACTSCSVTCLSSPGDCVITHWQLDGADSTYELTLRSLREELAQPTA